MLQFPSWAHAGRQRVASRPLRLAVHVQTTAIVAETMFGKVEGADIAKFNAQAEEVEQEMVVPIAKP